jgi:hypothetical protein
LKLKRIFLVEITSMLIILIAVLFLVEVSPYLIATKPNASIGMFQEKQIASNLVSLTKGQSASTQFNYTSFDPSIMVIVISFQNFVTPGVLTVNCNGKRVTTINVSSQRPEVRLNVLTVSGTDWLETSAGIAYSAFTYGNEITFTSNFRTGYEGTFSYQIKIRGSR